MDLRLAICGPGECGKNTVSRWFASNLGLRYLKSTSEAAAEIVYEKLKDAVTPKGVPYGYSSCDECWKDRRMHRVVWRDIISEYNQPDGIQLYRSMLKDHDIIDGIRCGAELRKCQDELMVDLSIWVHRDVMGDPSLDYGPEACDIVIQNTGSILELYDKLSRFGRLLAPFARY